MKEARRKRRKRKRSEVNRKRRAREEAVARVGKEGRRIHTGQLPR